MLLASITKVERSMESRCICYGPFQIIKKEKKMFQAPLVCFGRKLERKLLTLNLSNKCCCTIGFLVPELLGAPGVVVFVLTIFQIPRLPSTRW